MVKFTEPLIDFTIIPDKYRLMPRYAHGEMFVFHTQNGNLYIAGDTVEFIDHYY